MSDSTQAVDIPPAPAVPPDGRGAPDEVDRLYGDLEARLHNMRTLASLSPERQERIAAETMEIYAPIAHRLGMGKIRAELEDLAFRVLEPEASSGLLKEFEAAHVANETFLMEIKHTVE